jgi:ribosomal protein S18 acetylase RimI-like enzyme
MDLVDWSQEQKTAFLQMQFFAQHKHYQQNYMDAEFSIIIIDGSQAGRLYLDQREDEIRIVDIALLPQYRNQGIGTTIINEILAKGKASGLPVTIHVEQFNPAFRLYQRLGFQRIADDGVYFLMQWSLNKIS